MKLMDIRRKHALPDAASALPGRSEPMLITDQHAVLGSTLKAPFPDHSEKVLFGMGCFWGVERIFWKLPGVITTAVGYSAGLTPNPTYQEVCTGLTGHNEVARIIFDPNRLSFEALLQVFWENHDPTQGMRQGNDWGTQYRSGIYYDSSAQQAAAEASMRAYQARLTAAGFGEITTEIVAATEFYFAEDYHQQYLHKNPSGYCGIGGTGVSCPVGTAISAAPAGAMSAN